MDTSTPAPDSEASPPPQPRHEMLTSVAEQVAAIDTLISLAQRSIHVFDVDLSDMGWNGAERAGKLAAFLRSRRHARLAIIVHDTGWIERYGARLTRLLRNYGHAFTINRTGDDAKSAMDPLVIVDDTHFLHRLHVSQLRAALAIDAPDAAKPLVERFEAIRASSEPGLSGSVAGL